MQIAMHLGLAYAFDVSFYLSAEYVNCFQNLNRSLDFCDFHYGLK